jgi:hypothetical protein
MAVSLAQTLGDAHRGSLRHGAKHALARYNSNWEDVTNDALRVAVRVHADHCHRLVPLAAPH